VDAGGATRDSGLEYSGLGIWERPMERTDVVGVGGARPEWTLRVVQTSADPARPSSSPAMDERGLVEACRAGSRDAFEGLVERHQRSVYQLCYRYVGNHEDAADLTQEVFLRAYRGLRSFKGQAAFGTWLYRIGVNVCLNHIAARPPVAVPLEANRAAPRNAEDPAADLLRAEQAARVRRAITALPPRQRTVLILRLYRELPHQEIAALLGNSVGAVKANMFHALNNLRRLLKDPDRF
jgi:RNA polymerase sigma-70 factor, ECF subfamily